MDVKCILHFNFIPMHKYLIYYYNGRIIVYICLSLCKMYIVYSSDQFRLNVLLKGIRWYMRPKSPLCDRLTRDRNILSNPTITFLVQVYMFCLCFCHNHNVVVFSLMAYHLDCSKSDTTSYRNAHILYIHTVYLQYQCVKISVFVLGIFVSFVLRTSLMSF
jgi:hypothetical protein